MAKFSETFLQGLLQPTYQQGLFETAKNIGMTPGLMMAEKQRKAEQERRSKGILGGTMGIQQAAQSGMLTEEMLRGYAGSMQGLNVPNEQILKTVSDLRTVNQQAKETNRAANFVKSLGSEYEAQYSAGLSLKDVYDRYLEDNQQNSISVLARQLDPDLSEEMASNLSSSDLMDLYNARKTEGGAAKWAKWQGQNPEINDSNRNAAIEAAVAAHGADAPRVVADLEAKQLEIKAKREGKKSLSVLITMNSSSAFAGLDIVGGSKTQVVTRNLPVDESGKLTKEAKSWLEAHASTAMVQDTGQIWNPSPNSTEDGTLLGAPSGQNGGDGSTTLGTLVGPEVMNQALSNLEF